MPQYGLATFCFSLFNGLTPVGWAVFIPATTGAHPYCASPDTPAALVFLTRDMLACPRQRRFQANQPISPAKFPLAHASGTMHGAYPCRLHRQGNTHLFIARPSTTCSACYSPHTNLASTTHSTFPTHPSTHLTPHSTNSPISHIHC